MSIEDIRDRYGVPAKIDGRVRYTGDPGETKDGTIRWRRGSYLVILLDGDDHTRLFHPTWKLEYLEDES
ncbi:MAG: hypothetical protein KAJ73_00185 [Zetaproteobacteria bacterium]|nr:hypothetical protein [Zetaproteobacteria bacterium]